jgi:HEAT repeat protein
MKPKTNDAPRRTALLALVPCLFFFSFFFSPPSSAATAPEDDEKALIAVLGSDAGRFEKAKACQRLAVVGTKDAVPALAALLADRELSHYARFALEPIPDPAAGAALRAALDRVEGEALIGVVSSLGARRDAEALPALEALLEGADARAASAAALAIGRIGNARSAEVLHRALEKAPATPVARELASPPGSGVEGAVAEGCVLCAEALLQAGERERAAELYGAVRRRAGLPAPLRLAATRGALVARGAAARDLFLESLRGDDLAAAHVALSASRELAGAEVTAALVAALEVVPPERQALVLGILGERGDRTALPAVLAAAGSGPTATRAAALRALETLGDASALPVLLAAAAGSEAELATAARASLTRLRGGEAVDRAVVEALAAGGCDPALRAALVELAGRRSIRAAVPALQRALDDESEAVRLAAVTALGETIGLDDLSALGARLVAPRSAEEAEAARDALRVAVRRMPDQDACAAKLVGALDAAPAAAKGAFLEVLGALGGAKALAAVALRARDPDPAVREAAFRALGEWRSQDAGVELLALARSAESDAERLRALRALGELVRRLGFPKEERLAFCRQAMEVARRDEERVVVVETLAGIPAPETLAVLEPYLADPALKEPAAAALVAIGERIQRFHADLVARSMKAVLAATARKDLAERAKKLLR